MTMAIACAGLLVLALVAYATTGGADFGGGVWDLLASGPRRREQRALIEHAIAPVWEANHVWLIFAAVVLFTAFPAAYAAASIALHIPLVGLLLGVVLRGSAFVFRQYGGEPARVWGRVFAVASVITPVLLGVIAGALTSGQIVTTITREARFVDVYVAPWLQPFPFAVGLLALLLFAFLAAVYLAWEADDAALAEDFRRRALGTAIALGPVALATGMLAARGAPAFADRFLHSAWTWPLHVATAAAAITAIGALLRRRFGVARVAAFLQVSLILAGWAAGQYPYLIAPSLTIDNAQAPAATLALVLPVMAGGMGLLAPSLYWLFRVFKHGRTT